MDHQGDFGRNLSNALGQFTPSSPTPATIGAQTIQAPFHASASQSFSGATMPWSGRPDANAPETFQPESHPYWNMPQAGVPNAAASPLHGEELAARLAALNSMMSEPCEPTNYNTRGHGWPRPSPPRASGYPTLQANSYGATTWAPPVQQPGGQTSWAPPAQQPGGQASWAPPEQRPSAPAAGQTLTFEEFLMDAGVLDGRAVDDMVLQDLMQNLQAELGQGKPDGPMANLGRIGAPPPVGPGAVGSFSGPSRDQVGLYTMARAQEDDDDDDEEPFGRRDPEAAMARRSRRMAKRKEAIASRARRGN